MTSRIPASILAAASCAFLAMPTPAAAQSSTTIGVKGGVNVATLRVEEDEPNVKSLVGAVGGLFLAQQINDALSFRIEGLFSQKGANEAEIGEDAKSKLTYIDVPVLLTLRPSSSSETRFNVFTGPQVSFNIAATFTISGSPDIDFKDEVKSTDLGWVLGVGLERGRMTADARYTHGVSNLSKIGGDVKNRVLAVMIGGKFR